MHRRAGDPAFEGTYTTQSKMYTVLGDDTAPDETEFIAFFGWCNTVGGGIANVNNGTRETQRRWYVEDYKCSSVHGHGGGHTNPSYHNHAGVVITDQLAMPSPGHEPVNSVEIDDTKSHGHYHDGSRVGVRVFAGQDINDASSHAAQARTGAYFVDCIFSGNPIAVFVAAGQSILEDCIFYGGRDITGFGGRGWGFDSTSSMDKLIRPLFIGGAYASGFSVKCNHSSDAYAQDPTAGPKEYGEGRHFGSAWRGIEIQNGLFYNRPGIAIELTGSENINITNCLFKASGLPLKFNHTTGELTASNFTMDGNVFDIDDSTLAQVGGAAKTLGETEALVDGASGNTEESIVFVDPTRNPDTYAQMYLNDPTADSLELVNEACRQRGLGIYDPELEASFINDWIRTGFYSTSHPGKGPALTGPLQLMVTTPVDGETIVATDASIELVFSAPITLGSGTIRLYNSATDALVASEAAANLTIAGNTLTWETPATLIEGVGYYILTDAGLVNDGAGNDAAAITDPTLINFTAETHIEIGISNAGSSLADADSIELGNTIAIDQSTTVSLTITNAGSEPVTIGTITATGHVSIDAAIDPSGTVLAVGENATLGLIVDTSVSGAVAGGVSVPSGDAASPFDLSFTGTVVVAQTTGSGTHDVRQAYLDVAEADAILDEVMMGVQLLKQAWDSLQPADKIKCIANASDDFDALLWDGMPSSSSQVTAWPRRYWNGEAMLPDGDPIVPDAVGAGEWSFAGLPREIRIGVAIQSAWKAALALSLAEDKGDPARPISMLHSHAQKAVSPYHVRFVGAV